MIKKKKKKKIFQAYRAHENSTPMVCCDQCGVWVHASCDSISEEKYKDMGKEEYQCPRCRGVDLGAPKIAVGEEKSEDEGEPVGVVEKSKKTPSSASRRKNKNENSMKIPETPHFFNSESAKKKNNNKKKKTEDSEESVNWNTRKKNSSKKRSSEGKSRKKKEADDFISDQPLFEEEDEIEEYEREEEGEEEENITLKTLDEGEEILPESTRRKLKRRGAFDDDEIDLQLSSEEIK
jgi:hypothetical protein